MFDEINNKKVNDDGNKPPVAPLPKLDSGVVPVNKSLPAQKDLPVQVDVLKQAGLPPKTEDIFAEVEKGTKPEVFKPKISSPVPQDNLIGEEKSFFSGENKKFFALGLVVIFLVLTFAGGFYGLNRILKVNSVNKTNTNKEAQVEPVNKTEDNLNKNNVSQPEEKKEETQAPPNLDKPATVPPVDTQILDSDQDGLTDEEEGQLGTNISLPDSDNDGLFDREEVKVYGTNPLNADTDGDGYLDGEEVRSGYNPKGSGRLYEIK